MYSVPCVWAVVHGVAARSAALVMFREKYNFDRSALAVMIKAAMIKGGIVFVPDDNYSFTLIWYEYNPHKLGLIFFDA